MMTSKSKRFRFDYRRLIKVRLLRKYKFKFNIQNVDYRNCLFYHIGYYSYGTRTYSLARVLKSLFLDTVDM